MSRSKSKSTSRSKSKSTSRTKSKSTSRAKSVTRSKLKKETYYFSVGNVENHLIHKDEKHYTNKLITPLYLNRSMNGKSVGYYTAFHNHTIKQNKNNVHAEATIITPNGTLLAVSDWFTDVDRLYLNPKKQKIVHFEEETSVGYYKSSQVVLTALDEKNRKLCITYK